MDAFRSANPWVEDSALFSVIAGLPGLEETVRLAVPLPPACLAFRWPAQLLWRAGLG
jgi:hypothetical protein